MSRCLLSMLALAAALASFAAYAAPYVPSADDVVLERLPEKLDPARAPLRALRGAVARRPGDVDLAVRFARQAIATARTEGDPRYLGQAQAALAPWWRATDAPDAVRVLRATIRQGLHDFDGALADLDALLAGNPANAQARLTRATVLTVRGRYAEALRDCDALGMRVDAVVRAACAAAPRSLSGDAGGAYEALVAALDAGGSSAEVREWACTLAAEIAARRGDAAAALRHFAQARTLDAHDPYLKAAFADFLLARGDAARVRDLLVDDTRNDTLLLRLARAERDLPAHANDFRTHRDDLEARFAAAHLRGDALHRREEARFRLDLVGDAAAALALARDNWAVQREPADLLLLVDAARAAGDARVLDMARDWVAAHRLEDAAVRARLEPAAARTGMRDRGAHATREALP